MDVFFVLGFLYFTFANPMNLRPRGRMLDADLEENWNQVVGYNQRNNVIVINERRNNNVEDNPPPYRNVPFIV